MTKQELQLGQILETREGELFVNAGVQWLSEADWISPNDYNDDLTGGEFEELDIIKVYELNPTKIKGFNFHTPDTKHLKLIWERDETPEIEYLKITFEKAVELMRDGEEVFIEFTKGSRFSIELTEHYIEPLIETYSQILYIPDATKEMREFIQITEAMNYHFYRKVK